MLQTSSWNQINDDFRMRSLLLLLALTLILPSCRYVTGENGLFPDRSITYQEAPDLPPMVIPPELDSYTIDSLYVIPETIQGNEVAFEDIPLPKPIETRRQEGVIIQNLGDRRWIVLDATPAQVWPLARDYWTSLSVNLEYENPGAGILETAWLELDSDPTTRHKYRVTVEPGLHSGYAEVYIKHLQQGRDEPVPVVVSWPEESSSADREQQILNTLSQYLADRNDVYQASTASLLAGSIEVASKANLVVDAEQAQALELRIDYDRAWVQVRQALEEAEIEIVDSDRDQAVINVRFAGIMTEPEEAGFFGRILGRGERQEVMEYQDFTIRLQQSSDLITVVAEALSGNESGEILRGELLQAINDFIG